MKIIPELKLGDTTYHNVEVEARKYANNGATSLVLGVTLFGAMALTVFSAYTNQLWAMWAWAILLPYLGYSFGEELRLYRAYKEYLRAEAKLAAQIYAYYPYDYEKDSFDAEDA